MQACRLFLSFFVLIISVIICTQAAAELLKVDVAFTLVDPKEYFHHCVGALRAAVNPGNFLDKHIRDGRPAPRGGGVPRPALHCGEGGGLPALTRPVKMIKTAK